MAVVGTLAMNLVANSSGFTSSINAAARSIDSFQNRMRSFGGQMGGQLTAALGIGGGVGFLGWGMKLAADAEAAQAQFAILANSGEKARQMLADIKAFSQSSPLSQSGLRDAAVTMMSFGVSAEAIMPTLRQLGDVTGGNQERLGSMALAFGQMTAAGRMMGQDLLQMINAGFNPLQEISRKTGESMAELKARMEAGGISSKEVADAFDSATAAGGRFHGMLDARAATTAGQFAKMQAATASLAQSIGESLLPAANNLLAVITPVVQSFAQMDENTRTNLVTLGALAAGITVGVVALGTIVRAVSAVVAAYRAMATASAIAQALSGPKGWASLAGSALVAAGAVAGVAYLFDKTATAAAATSVKASQAAEQTAKIGQSGEQVKKTAEAAFDLAKAFDAVKFSPETDVDRQAAKLDDLMKRGHDMAQQFRTPGEVFRDTVTELNSLLAVGAVGAETYRRAMSQARRDVADAAEHMDRMRGVGAVSLGTREGFSAVQEALRNMDVQKAREAAVARAEDAVAPAVRETGEKTTDAIWEVHEKLGDVEELLTRNAALRLDPIFQVANF